MTTGAMHTLRSRKRCESQAGHWPVGKEREWHRLRYSDSKEQAGSDAFTISTAFSKVSESRRSSSASAMNRCMAASDLCVGLCSVYSMLIDRRTFVVRL